MAAVANEEPVVANADVVAGEYLPWHVPCNDGSDGACNDGASGIN